METQELPSAKRILEERLSLAINKERNKFREETGLDLQAITVNFVIAKSGSGETLIFLDGVTVELFI